ncbi:tRNA lysidine(34) synthetase TilS [Qipengyuania algicida]|uniref:tRNA lysidine(34) synthetase TilS n=1 Tax=Qipengyuania algicida TaxID=1836209 RepID=UPI00301D3EE3
MWPEIAGEDARLGVAVSGGPDSLALLILSAMIMPGRVEAATVDHGLRAESAEEAATVASLCQDIGVPHSTLPVEVAAGNVQAQAREARYAALAQWLDRRGLAALATGHQLDDQAETLMMRLHRGSGIAGLAGVRPRGNVPGTDLALLRPLLGWRRAELEALVEDAELTPVRDPSNDDLRFERVRVRRLLASQDGIDPSGLARSAQLLADAEAYLNAQVDLAWRNWVVQTSDGFGYALGQAHSFEAVEIILRIGAELGADISRGDARTMVDRLRAGENASLGGMLARPDLEGVWHFEPEPPRRTG